MAPGDPAAREELLRETFVTAGPVIRTDTHKVPIYAIGDDRVRKRPIQLGDRANLWTWHDWMLSTSSNAAASTLIEQLLLLRHFGAEYPVAPDRADAYFSETPKGQLHQALLSALREPVTRSGLDLSSLRQGGFFTAEGKRKVPGGDSNSTPRELMRFLLRLEQGRLVDEWSSLELKRLLYMTDRRIRYASHPALDDAAVYFKSGSLYSCRAEPGFVCEKYHGNVRNFMNSVAIVETAGERPLHYLVVVLSNVLRKNSAVDHQSLAMRIHRLIERHHPKPPSPPPIDPPDVNESETAAPSAP